jgi:hypothetical protein
MPDSVILDLIESNQKQLDIRSTIASIVNGNCGCLNRHSHNLADGDSKTGTTKLVQRWHNYSSTLS